MTAEFCRFMVDGRFEHVVQDDKLIDKVKEDIDISLETLTREDRKYGYIKPDKYGFITFKVHDGDDEISTEIAEYLVGVALADWAYELKIKFRVAKPGEKATVNIYFRHRKDDPVLTGNTLAYMYYPMDPSFQNLARGKCVFNADYYFTAHGKSMNMHLLFPKQYPDPNTKSTGKTYDFDVIMKHEGGHGIFGLIHDGKPGNNMSAIYSAFVKLITKRDIHRGGKKFGIRTWLNPITKLRVRRWYEKYKMDNLPGWLFEDGTDRKPPT